MVAEFKKNRKFFSDSVIFPALLGILLVVIAGFLALSNFKIGSRTADLKDERQYLEGQLKVAQDKETQLQQQVSNATQTDYLETEAREVFNLKKPGETVVTVIPASNTASQVQTQKQWWNPFTW